MGRGGERSEDTEQQASDLQSHPLFADFLQEGFTATEFASNALAGSTATAQAKVEQLEGGIRELNDRLSQEVTLRQDELLEQAASLRDAEGAVQSITLAAESLQSSLSRVRDELTEPYQEIRIKVVQLKNLHSAVDLLRHILQSIKVTQRLRAHVGAGAAGSASSSVEKLGILDLGKAAKLLSDIAAVSHEADFSGIEVIAADAELLDATRQQVWVQAQAALEKGMESLSQAEVGSALQVYFNLQELPKAVEGLLNGYLTSLGKSLTAALDSRKLASEVGGSVSGLLGGPGGARAAGASVKVQEALWQQLAVFMDQLHKASVAVWHLQRVLAKKRDPLSHVLFLESLAEEGAPLPLVHFWARVTKALKFALEDATSPGRGGVIREALVQGYPRLAGLLDDLFKKLRQDTDVKSVRPAATAEEQDELVNATAVCQNVYLAAVLARVSEAVNAAFAGGNRALPTAAELHKCIGRLHEELKTVGESPRLAALTAHAVGKSLHLLAEKAEYMAATGQELRTVTGACTSAQLRNLTLCNQLQEVARAVASFLPRLPAAAATSLRVPLETLEAGAVDAVMPLMRAVVERAEALVLKVHEQGFGSEDTPDVTRASSYMQDLSRHLSHSRVEYLSKFSPAANPQNSGSVGAALTQRFASRLLVFFVRHASLLRPLSQAGKLQLAKDIAELEESVGSNLWPIEQLGPPQRVLRAFRRLLFLETTALADSPLLAELPSSIVLHHLYCRAPTALQSPHTRSGFTPQQYSLWLDQHTMPEVLRYIKSALEACSADAKEEQGYEEVYPIMHKLCSYSG